MTAYHLGLTIDLFGCALVNCLETFRDHLRKCCANVLLDRMCKEGKIEDSVGCEEDKAGLRKCRSRDLERQTCRQFVLTS